MREQVLASVLANPRVEPVMQIWGWQIATYLFLGGVTAGLMVFSAWAVLGRRNAPFAAYRAPLVGLVVLALGMTTLFADLDRKINVWRFYTTLHVTSVMSWGSWILLLVFPALILFMLGGLQQGFAPLARLARALPLVGGLLGWLIAQCERWRAWLAAANLVLGIGLGIYTGVLLSGFNARPFWHSALLGPLFLVSGLSTGAAMMILGAREAEERHLFGRIDLLLIVVELALLGLLLADMLNGNALQRDAVRHLLGGAQTGVFWIGFIAAGLVLPLLLEAAGWRRPLLGGGMLAAVLVLGGGYLLRDIVVQTGQQTSWTHFDNQFDPSLLARLRHDGFDPAGRF
ncbi:NrfD/PsrC family molybdoenzyme membrane anchor subunit [Metallibacterium scheffleri]|jgi:formate-dependent nitrite reductase membrane component NrfD|uniref:NrfD/PsrC family molybdoenzyme membrane anchor subunit n=1 Tax=Metallibacterium scheffleri TaxID=993689 RepID=UPI0026EA9FAF|nr:NrfD/PsrC family molybdoenzyme membrane anchor subunit [Metallibacterium scheffleri]MBW8075184.1 polysulfide reductase [Metallibacterium scheffleri]